MGDFHGNLLSWAARLHELGTAIAHNQYHKHGAYVLQNADLPGFSRQEQFLLGTLVRLHRRKFASELLSRLEPKTCAFMARLAVVLHRNRTGIEVPSIVTDSTDGLQISFTNNWLEAHPLTRADLEQESGYAHAAGFSLSLLRGAANLNNGQVARDSSRSVCTERACLPALGNSRA